MRRNYIDWARAIAILVMIEAHTLDAWTRAADRATLPFRDLTVLGGFAAPLFLWVAGIALAFSAERTFQRTGSAAEAASAVCRRGLEIFILAFLFRIQAFIVSPGSHPVMLFRVDILNIMGPAIVAAGILLGIFRGTRERAIAFSVATFLTATATPLIREAAWVRALPTWIQWYLHPAAEYTTFTLFPWVAFLFAGGAVGAVLARGREERRAHVWIAAAGGCLIATGFAFAARPSLYRVSSFWTTSPAFFEIRLGAMMLLLPTLYGLEQLLGRIGRHLTAVGRLGRSSLLIYWIHVELVYGYASWPLHRRLSLAELALAYIIFVALLYAVILLRDDVVRRWASRRPSRRVAPATA